MSTETNSAPADNTATSEPAAADANRTLIPSEGLGVLHLFYKFNLSAWEEVYPEDQQERKAELEALVAQAREVERGDIKTISVLGRADLGFMLIGPDLHALNELEKKINRVLGPDVLDLEFSYFSMTERSEYSSTPDEFRDKLQKEEGLTPGTPEYEKRYEEIKERLEKYTYYRMYPELPDWPFVCFYPMSKRRDPGANWYALSFDERKQLMGGHARVGRSYAGRVTQLVSGSTGLDDWEWGVTLFAKDPLDIKSIVYEMRFDKVTHDFGQFGPFFNGLQMPISDIFERLGA